MGVSISNQPVTALDMQSDGVQGTNRRDAPDERSVPRQQYLEGFNTVGVSKPEADSTHRPALVAAPGARHTRYSDTQVRPEQLTNRLRQRFRHRLGYSTFQQRFIRDTEDAPVSYTHLRAHETRHDLVCR